MAFQRSIRSKLLEAIRLIFLADETVQEYWKARVSVGKQTVQDGNIITPQIVLVPRPMNFEVGVAGVAHPQIVIGIGMFEPFRRDSEPIGEIRAEDRIVHLETLILAGSRGDEEMPGSPGQIIDPDNPRSVDPTQRYLNITYADFREREPFEVLNQQQKEIALLYPFDVAFETRVDNEDPNLRS